ncbi:MAG: hydrogenase nickel incorporation protein HypB [Bacteroidales bacterium]|nr:hydrogenase nickel incorporation protein HypB [Bacteroidales bacterium]
MCDTCGCSNNSGYTIITSSGGHTHHGDDHQHPHTHPHQHDHGNEENHSHHHHSGKIIEVEKDALYHNNLLAERNRGFFEAKNIVALNLVSSPGAGKTLLLEKTVQSRQVKRIISVIEGDQQTTRDADRIKSAGVPVVQVNTGSGCHLDASMVHSALKELQPPDNSILMIENVGNLVCPAMFDLGETARVVVISVTEGEDKPLKYPYMFQSSHVCIINKTDLLPHLDFNLDELKNNALKINHHLQFFEISLRSGTGLENWLEWLNKQ